MAVATLTLTSNSYPNGNDNSQIRQRKFGLVSVIGSSPSYVQGGLRANFASLETIKSSPAFLLPQWLDLATLAGSGYIYTYSPRGPIITNLALTSNVVTITAKNNLAVGDIVTLSGLTTSTFLNGAKVTVKSGVSATAFTFDYTHADVGTAAETGNALPTTYANGLPFQGNIQIFQSAGSAAALAELSTASLPAGVTGDTIGFRAEFIRS